MFPIYSSGDPRVGPLLDRRVTQDARLQRLVRRIVNAVRSHGDAALTKYAREFDDWSGPLEVPARALRTAAAAVPKDVRAALATCARNIETVARRQVPRPSTVRVAPGLTVEQRVVPLDRVGCYVPGGRYPLPSSLLMTAIPARVAGVGEVIAVCPKPDAVVMAAAVEAGVDRLFRIGGAQAIAALAYGTPTVPRVDKIVGPGNRFVAAAKSMVECPTDMEAGPSELVWLTDDAPPEWVAWDLIAQAEHDPDARVLLVTTKKRVAMAVREAILQHTPSEGPARLALERNGAAIVARSATEAFDLVDRVAPEHLATDMSARRTPHTSKAARTRGFEDDGRWPTAGTVFVGPFAVPASGDYATGSNHVLPTAGVARFRGGLSAADFVRTVSVQRVSRVGLAAVATAAATMARVEGLIGHRASIEARLASKEAR